VPTTSPSSPQQIPASPGPNLETARLFAGKDRLARLALGGLMISGGLNLLMATLLLRSSNQAPWIVALDAASNPYVSRGTRFAEAKQLHVDQAIAATTTLLYRNPGGFVLPERVNDLFAPAAAEAAVTLKNAELPEFQDKAIFQRAFIAKIEALETRPDRVLVKVDGKLDRRGVFRQQSFTETVPFVLTLSFTFNPDLLRSGRMPTLVDHFQLRYERAD